MSYQIKRSDEEVNEQLNRCAWEMDAGRPGAADVAAFFDWLTGFSEEPAFANEVEEDEDPEAER